MDLKGAVTKYVNDSIKNAPVDVELKKAARLNHRFKGFVDKMYTQLLEVDKHRARQGKPRLKAKTVQSTVQEFVHTYLKGIETEALRRAESDIARELRERAEQKQKDLEASATDKTGKLHGDYAELQEGLKTSDERDVT